jgi:outer membrane protein assembly factor BamE
MRLFKFMSCLLGSIFLTGCIYKMEIQQGNLVTLDQIDELAMGMSEQEVLAILGTPLLQDPFSPGRWDYVYQLQEKGELVAQRNVTVYFNDEGRLVKIQRHSTDF